MLKAGANPRRADNAGLTPLHWSAVKGNSGCIKRILEAGGESTLLVKDNNGKTPKDMAVELKSFAAFKRGLLEAGYDEAGNKLRNKFSEFWTRRLIFLIPSVGMGVVLMTLSGLNWWSGALVGTAECFLMHHLVAKVLLGINGPETQERLPKSPYLCSIIAASIFWVLYVWLTRFVSGTFNPPSFVCFENESHPGFSLQEQRVTEERICYLLSQRRLVVILFIKLLL